MGHSLRKWIVLFAYLSLPLFFSCEKHELGQMPEVQREKGAEEKGGEPSAAAVPVGKPATKGTPAEFFPSATP